VANDAEAGSKPESDKREQAADRTAKLLACGCLVAGLGIVPFGVALVWIFSYFDPSRIDPLVFALAAVGLLVSGVGTAAFVAGLAMPVADWLMRLARGSRRRG
jgi:hypothetical protein